VPLIPRHTSGTATFQPAALRPAAPMQLVEIVMASDATAWGGISWDYDGPEVGKVWEGWGGGLASPTWETAHSTIIATQLIPPCYHHLSADAQHRASGSHSLD